MSAKSTGIAFGFFPSPSFAWILMASSGPRVSCALSQRGQCLGGEPSKEAGERDGWQHHGDRTRVATPRERIQR